MIDRQQYIDVLRAAGDFAHGGRPEFVAVEWMAEGFSPAETKKWLNARCFDAVAAKKLADSGITPEDATRPHGESTLGYAVSNLELTIAQARELIGWGYLGEARLT